MTTQQFFLAAGIGVLIFCAVCALCLAALAYYDHRKYRSNR